VLLDGGQFINQVTTNERLSLSNDDILKGYRLACCAKIDREGEVVVNVPSESNVDQRRLLVAGVHTTVPLNPAVRKIIVHLERPTIHHIRSDAETVQEAAAKQANCNHLTFSHQAMTQLPAAIRTGGWVVTITMFCEKEIIRVQPGECSDGIYGLAVDVGSTKLAAYLLNLKDGVVVSTSSCANPQIPFGDDIISRISYAKDDANLKKLQGLVVAAINKLLAETCTTAGISTADVCDLVAVGNTAMHHFFLGISPKYLAMSPYAPVVRTNVTVSSHEIGLHPNPGAYVYLLPNIAGFVGADAVADVLATGIYESDNPSLLIDIGTNTEIVMGDRHRLVSCSCASGPALEGGSVTHGMRAETGAIERVYINPQDLEPGYQTIGNAPPRGICGSGILDVVASLFLSGVIERNGKLNSTPMTSRLRKEGSLREYVVAWGKETKTGNDIAVNQNDIQEILLAKAAIFAGSSILMRELQLKGDDIANVFLAGAFGTYTDPQSALIVGMYPDIPLSRIQFVGNSAGSGARMALRSRETRDKAERLAREVEYIELAADSLFSRELADALCLPHKDKALFPTVNELLESRSRFVPQLGSKTASLPQ
jgi:uncharacterized 2Fe-2S/4Fe-4S cluster protein (DUF4445 family)